jgi:hypothetical protein
LGTGRRRSTHERLIESRRRSDLITPVPKAKKRKAPKGPTVQVELELTADDEGLSTAEQKYDPTPIINELRGYVDTWRALPNPRSGRSRPRPRACCSTGGSTSFRASGRSSARSRRSRPRSG